MYTGMVVFDLGGQVLKFANSWASSDIANPNNFLGVPVLNCLQIANFYKILHTSVSIQSKIGFYTIFIMHTFEFNPYMKI
jgi:hypothetical protein